MSQQFDILTFVKDRLSGETEVPDSKIWITKPSQAFIGEGPIIVIYPMDSDRQVHSGDSNWHTSSERQFEISVDVLVDDIWNKPANSNTIESMCEIQEQIELSLFGDRLEAATILAETMDLKAFKPGKTQPYELESESGVMVGVRIVLSLTFIEYWQREARDTYINTHVGIIESETTQRGFNFDTNDNG